MQSGRKREIWSEAEAFREVCRCSKYGIIDLFKECERCGYKLLRYPLGESGVLGFAMKKEKDTVIFTNSCSRLSREIFTLAHEIGHIILHFQEAVSFVDDAAAIAEKSTDAKEQEANYFAACLLMPEDKVGKFLDLELEDLVQNGLTAMDIARIMSEFQVSFEMALNRLENLGKIDSAGRIRIDNERNETRVGNLLRNVGGNSRLNEVTKEISIPYEFLEYAIYNYNHRAIPLETLEKALACYRLTAEDVRDKLISHTRHTQAEDDLEELIGGLED